MMPRSGMAARSEMALPAFIFMQLKCTVAMFAFPVSE